MTCRYKLQPVDNVGVREYVKIYNGDIKSAMQKLAIINGSIQTILQKDEIYFVRFKNERCYIVSKV